MKEFKTGDRVYHDDSDNGLYFIGTLSITEDHMVDGVAKEADLEFTNGSSVSPVSLSCCQHVSDDLFRYVSHLEKIRDKIGVMAQEDLGMQYNEH